MWINRILEKKILDSYKTRPALLLTGVRQSGKTSLLKKVFPEAKYITFDKVSTAGYAEENPVAFFNEVKEQKQVILDEVQYVPGLFRELKIQIDEDRKTYGKWILTGSQKFSLMQNISESLAGRISIFNLETLSADELRTSSLFKNIDEIMFKGGYPEIWSNHNIQIQQFYDDYIQTYLERDLREIINVSNLRDFQRFMKLCAARAGNLLNYADLSKDIGVSPNTVKAWINTLETSGIVMLLQPFFGNIGKRFIKSPKIFFSDQGLLCNLLNIQKKENIKGHVYEGILWENFVFTELIKNYDIRPAKNMFYYRDQNNVEIDFLIEKDNITFLIEAKANEVVSDKKLNFKKVKPLFKNKVKCILACPLNESSIIKLKDYDMVNPVNHKILND